MKTRKNTNFIVKRDKMHFVRNFLFAVIFSGILWLANKAVKAADSKEFGYQRTPEKIFKGCLTTKLCFAPKDDAKDEDSNCIEEANCKHLIALGTDEKDNNTRDQVVIELYSHAKAWFSIGLSHDKKMGDDYVLTCLRPNVSRFHFVDADQTEKLRRPIVENSWNHCFAKKRCTNEHLEDETNIQLVESIATGLTIYCKFYVLKRFTKIDPFKKQSHTYDLDKKFCILSAWGNKFKADEEKTYYGSQDEIKERKVFHGKNNLAVCKSWTQISTNYQPSNEQKTYLQYHGICMIITWMFFVAVGNFVGCFYKDIYKKLKFLNFRTWLLLHCIFVVCSCITMAFGIYLQFVGQGTWRGRVRQKIHQYGGYTVYICFSISALLGIISGCRKTDGPNYRKDEIHYPAFFHSFLSHSTQLLACLIIATSAELQFGGVSCHLGYLALGTIVIYWLLNLFMHFHKFWAPVLMDDGDNNVVDRTETNFSMLTEIKSKHQDNKKALRIKTCALIIFGCVAFFATISLILLLLWPPIGPCFTHESDSFFNKKIYEKYKNQEQLDAVDEFVANWTKFELDYEL